MTKKPSPIYDCPNRYSNTNCHEQLRVCDAGRRDLLRDRRDAIKQVSASVMDAYEGIVTHTEGWGNLSAVQALKSVYELVAKERADALPEVTVVFSGATLFRQNCTAFVQVTN